MAKMPSDKKRGKVKPQGVPTVKQEPETSASTTGSEQSDDDNKKLTSTPRTPSQRKGKGENGPARVKREAAMESKRNRAEEQYQPGEQVAVPSTPRRPKPVVKGEPVRPKSATISPEQQRVARQAVEDEAPPTQKPASAVNLFPTSPRPDLPHRKRAREEAEKDEGIQHEEAGGEDSLSLEDHGNTIVDFGMHRGRTYKEVYDSYPGYCYNFALAVIDPSPPLTELIEYVKRRDAAEREARNRRREDLKSALHRRQAMAGTTLQGLHQQEHCDDDDDGIYDDYEPFEAWMDRYVSSHLGKGLLGYCWEWLDEGYCGGPCRYLHTYPRSWTEAQKQQHAAKRTRAAYNWYLSR